MKYITALLAAAVAGVVAHEGHDHTTLGDYVPECSLKCLSDARKSATTCKDDTELECFCILENYRAIYDASVACVMVACGQDVAVAEVLPSVISMCDEVAPMTTTIGGGTLELPTDSASSSAGPAATPTTTDDAAPAETSAPGSGAAGLTAGLVGAALPLAMVALL
ncbi:uncharacterized protein QC764_700130 [Podospora pseudoanserina]|uniref:CFEM domain-containing protein n=1 Tax=Podospora pseudoanserina TaxID=2609844 RepID=A0ABR0HMA4_9PEZI|nr:hypothetical protein QC764_700130 [Podospora pseudoanserina]